MTLLENNSAFEITAHFLHNKTHTHTHTHTTSE